MLSGFGGLLPSTEANVRTKRQKVSESSKTKLHIYIDIYIYMYLCYIYIIYMKLGFATLSYLLPLSTYVCLGDFSPTRKFTKHDMNLFQQNHTNCDTFLRIEHMLNL